MPERSPRTGEMRVWECAGCDREVVQNMDGTGESPPANCPDCNGFYSYGLKRHIMSKDMKAESRELTGDVYGTMDYWHQYSIDVVESPTPPWK